MNAPKSVEYREAVARIIDPRLADAGWIMNYASYVNEVHAIATAKADAILALSGPVSGMDTSSVAEVPSSQGGSDHQGLTSLERELIEALRPFAGIAPSSLYPADGSEAEGYSVLTFEHDRLGHQLTPDFTGTDLAAARSAIAKVEATATAAQHAGQWVLVPREPTEAMIGSVHWVRVRGEHTTEHVMAQAYRAMIAAAPSPPAAPPSPAPPSSEREGSRA